MTAAFLRLMFVLCVASVARAGEGKFEIRAFADGTAPPARHYAFVDENNNINQLFLAPEILLDTTALGSAAARVEPSGWVISVTLTDKGAKRFGEITTKFLNRTLAVLIDDRVYCTPVVKTPVPGGSLEISGRFTEAEAKKLAADLNAAAGRQKPAATPGNP